MSWKTTAVEVAGVVYHDARGCRRFLCCGDLYHWPSAKKSGRRAEVRLIVCRRCKKEHRR